MLSDYKWKVQLANILIKICCFFNCFSFLIRMLRTLRQKVLPLKEYLHRIRVVVGICGR